MARMLNAFMRTALLALACCPGCAYGRRTEHTVNPSGPGINVDDDGGLVKGLLQDASDASMRNWNFNNNRW